MLLTVIGLGILSAVAVLFINKYSPENAVLVSISAGIVILILILTVLSDLFGEIESLFSGYGLQAEIFKLTLKALGICYTVGFAVDTCRDFGQSSLASKIELAGKITVVIMTLPLISNILEMAVALIK